MNQKIAFEVLALNDFTTDFAPYFVNLPYVNYLLEKEIM